jgi:hypothetical protein
MQKQKKQEHGRAPRFMMAAVLGAGLMLGSCAGQPRAQIPVRQPAEHTVAQEHKDCITLRDAMRERVNTCKDSADFGACVFGRRMLFSTKYSGTEEVEVTAELKQDILFEAGASLMSNGMGRELTIREIRPDGVLFSMSFGSRERPTIQKGHRQMASIGGNRQLGQLDRVISGTVFFRFDGGNEDEANSSISGMEVEIMSVERTANGVLVRIVADIYENCLER